MIMKKHITYVLLLGLFCSCSGFLEPLPNGSYNEDNHEDYPKLIRGYVEKAYDMRPSSYVSTDFIGCDGLADNMTWSSRSNDSYKLATGAPSMSSYSFTSIYQRDYQAIYYCNLFLKDDIGRNTRYLLDADANAKLQKALQGDAYALRAWYMYDLLKFFGGRSADGQMLGVPILTEPVNPDDADMSGIQRATYEECVNQILKDCDSAFVNLPLGNRDFLKGDEMIPVLGAVRYRKMDGASIMALKALVLLTWASPAFNPYDDISRWDAAAKAAKAAIDYKLEFEGSVTGGFSPTDPFVWKNANSPEAFYISNITQNSTYEEAFYPQGFGGTAKFAPTQELVDAFPMANGYPIDHPLSGYDEKKPYADRDPRFYASIFYHGSRVVRNSNESDVMYTFNTAEGGTDAPGRGNTSPTSYYIRKHVYTGWNPYDNTIQTAQSCIFFYRWTHMLLAFAEAANQVVGPIDESTYGMSPKQAIAYIRNRSLEDGSIGVGATGDPYLDDVAMTGGALGFDKLVKNEWRVETCFEGFRFHNVRRWAKSVDEINVDINKMKVTRSLDGKVSYQREKLESRRYPSLWLPFPYMEIRRSPLMVQNEGWESWN